MIDWKVVRASENRAVPFDHLIYILCLLLLHIEQLPGLFSVKNRYFCAK